MFSFLNQNFTGKKKRALSFLFLHFMSDYVTKQVDQLLN